MKEEGVFKEENEKIRYTDAFEIKRIDKCSECPCHYVHIDDRGEHNDDRCTLLDADLYHAWDEDVAPNCPLKNKPIVLYRPDRLIAVEINWKITF